MAGSVLIGVHGKIAVASGEPRGARFELIEASRTAPRARQAVSPAYGLSSPPLRPFSRLASPLRFDLFPVFLARQVLPLYRVEQSLQPQ
jgi:hypothetical protein